jgi:hypothetical protein
VTTITEDGLIAFDSHCGHKGSKNMKHYRLVLVFLSAVAILSSHALGQQDGKKQVFVGVGIGSEKGLEFTQLNALDSIVVERAIQTESPLVSRALVSATATVCCKPAVKVGSDCWHCCDSTYICTSDSQYSALVERSTHVSNEEWFAASKNGLDKIPRWPEIAELLAKYKPIPIEKTDPRFGKFQKEMGQTK